VAWREFTPLPAGPSGKSVKKGGWLTSDPATALVYTGKGNKTGDFYCYDLADHNWDSLAPIPDGSRRGRPRPTGHGTRGVADGSGHIYLTSGSNTLCFWRYDIVLDTWCRLPDIPTGNSRKRMRCGDLVWVELGDTGWVYLLKGNRCDFCRYNTATGTWQILPDAPTGSRGRWKKGSWLVHDGDSMLYAHKARYHELWPFNLRTGTWGQQLAGMPFFSYTGRHKKSKQGGAGAWHEQYIYALKGGNTQELWRYSVNEDKWVELETLPSCGSTGKKKRVNQGGDIVSWENGNVPAILLVLKGNETCEFWMYEGGPYQDDAAGRRRRDTHASPVSTRVSSFALRVAPNPAQDFTVLTTVSKASVNWALVDVAGRRCLTGSGPGRIDLRGLSPGVYLVQVSSQAGTATRKLVVRN
jgi:hypothetical protein